MKKPWYEIKGAASGPVEIFLYGVFDPYWGLTAEQFIADVKPFRDQPILLRISSRGGDVFTAVTIASYIQSLKDATAQIDALCASSATLPALACKTTQMARNGFFMVHHPTGSPGDRTADQLRQDADWIDKVGDMFKDAYVRATGATEKQVRKWMDNETYFNAEEAKAAGFIDAITDEVSLAAIAGEDFAPILNFGHPPEKLRAAIATRTDRTTNPEPADPPAPETMEALLKALVAAGLIPSAKLSDADAAEFFRAEHKKLVDRVTAAEAKVTAADARAAETVKKAGEAAVAAAVAAGRITDTKELRERWLNSYLTDPESTQAMLDGMTAAAPPVDPKRRAGGPPAPDLATDGTPQTLDDLRAALAKETDPTKRYQLGLKARELRGQATTFAAPKRN